MKQDKNLTEKDLHYEARKERLHALREDIKLGKEVMYDFDESMKKLLSSLL